MSKEPKVDAYIVKAQPFAQSIMEHIRNIVHQACPQAAETMKWSFPHFDYNGKIMCSMAAFKNHCAFGFWLAADMKTMAPYLKNLETSNGMGHFGKITSVNDLPPAKVLIKMVKEAMDLSDKGVVLKRAVPSQADLEVPVDFAKALAKNKKSNEVFKKAAPSFRKEYIQWVTGAKTAETRASRINTAVEWLAEGKSRNWKYERKG